MPDYDYIRKELLRNGVSKKLLWTEYMEDCRANGDEPLMYSQFCYHIQQDEQKHRATMHINRKPSEQVEVDWAGDPATIIDPDTGEIIKAYIFVGVMTYSQYAYVEAFLDMKQKSWINAHVHMYEYFGGVAKILVPDNCKTAVVHNGGWKDQQINETYQELAEHYGTAIIPSRVRAPKDKPNAEGTVLLYTPFPSETEGASENLPPRKESGIRYGSNHSEFSSAPLLPSAFLHKVSLPVSILLMSR